MEGGGQGREGGEALRGDTRAMQINTGKHVRSLLRLFIYSFACLFVYLSLFLPCLYSCFLVSLFLHLFIYLCSISISLSLPFSLRISTSVFYFIFTSVINCISTSILPFSQPLYFNSFSLFSLSYNLEKFYFPTISLSFLFSLPTPNFFIFFFLLSYLFFTTVVRDVLTATTLNNLGVLLKNEKRLYEAHHSYSEALEIRR
jgi:hypothetical protein